MSMINRLNLKRLYFLIGVCAPLFFHTGVSLANIIVTDDLGHKIQLQKPAKRIISLAPHLTELLFSAGAGHDIIGVDAYSNFPPMARHLKRIGNYSGFDLEKIVTLKPDLIVAWASGNSPAQLRILQNLGIPIYFSEPRKITDIPKTIKNFGLLTNNQLQADKVAFGFQKQLAMLEKHYSHQIKISLF